MKYKSHMKPLATALLFALSTGSVFAQVVFIPEGSANSVLAVNADDGTPIRRIPDLEAVHGLSSANGLKVLVAGSLTEIEPESSGEEIKPPGVSSEDHAAHHATSNDETNVPGGMQVSLLSLISSDTGDVLRKIKVPGAVHHTAISPSERLAVATHPSGDGISVVDLVENEFKTFVPTGAGSNYAVFGVDSNLVYVSNTGNGTISEVDLGREIVLRNFPVGDSPEHIVFLKSSGALYVADSNAGRVAELIVDSGEVRRVFELGGEIHGLDVSPDSRRLFVGGTSNDRLHAIDLETGRIDSAPLSPAPYHLTTISGSNRLFVSSREEPIVWIVDGSDLSVKQKIPVHGEGHQMTVLY